MAVDTPRSLPVRQAERRRGRPAPRRERREVDGDRLRRGRRGRDASVPRTASRTSGSPRARSLRRVSRVSRWMCTPSPAPPAFRAARAAPTREWAEAGCVDRGRGVILPQFIAWRVTNGPAGIRQMRSFVRRFKDRTALGGAWTQSPVSRDERYARRRYRTLTQRTHAHVGPMVTALLAALLRGRGQAVRVRSRGPARRPGGRGGVQGTRRVRAKYRPFFGSRCWSERCILSRRTLSERPPP